MPDKEKNPLNQDTAPGHGNSFSVMRYEYNIESIFPILRGWRISRDNPETICDLEIFIDNSPIATIRNDKQRKDLERVKKVASCGGFREGAIYCGLKPGNYALKIKFPDGTFSSPCEFRVEQPDYQCHIERLIPDLKGWCVDNSNIAATFPLELYVNNSLFTIIKNGEY